MTKGHQMPASTHDAVEARRETFLCVIAVTLLGDWQMYIV